MTKTWIKRGLMGATRLAGRFQDHKVVILMYHSVLITLTPRPLADPSRSRCR